MNQEIYNRLETYRKSQKHFQENTVDIKTKQEEHEDRLEQLYNNYFDISENMNQFVTKNELQESLKQYSDKIIEPILMELITNLEQLSGELKVLQNKYTLQTPRLSSANLKPRMISPQNLMDNYKLQKEQSQLDLDLKPVDLQSVETVIIE